MRYALFAIVAALGFWAPAAFAQSSDITASNITADDRRAIRAVIEDQLAAFQRDDGPAAFAHATARIQARFQTPEMFMRMVRAGYQPVYRPRLVEFRDIIEWHGMPTQRVYLVGPDGVPVIALYPMERQGDGSWNIDGCILVRASDDMV